MLGYFAEHYLVTIVASVAFIIFIYCDSTETRSRMRGFIWSAICIIFLCIAEMTEYYYSTLEYPCVMRTVLSALAYSLRPAIIFFAVWFPVKRVSKKLGNLLPIPLIVEVLLSFSALIWPLAFSYDEGNHYHRGPLGGIVFIVVAFYLVILLLLAIRRIRKGAVTDTVICVTALVVCAVGVYLEVELSHVGILPEIAIFTEIFYLAYLTMTKYSTDYLTGAFLRSHMYKEVETRMCDRFYIIFDVNGLKKINDNQGHAAGDEALVCFSNAVFENITSSALFYRLGGDEFAVIFRTSDESEVQALIEKIKKGCTKLPYSVSSGYAHFVKAQDFEKACKEADDMLYENKREFWESYNNAQ